MKDRARAVVIGGGVGGAAVLYWLARLGWDDVVLVERADLTSGSTFHSAGLVGQLRGSLSLTKMMMPRSISTARWRRRSAWRPAGTRSARCGWRRRRSGWRSSQRQAGWAQTFGLPIELISAEDAQRLFPPMSTEGVLGAALPPDRRLHRPQPADVRARRGRPAPRGRAPYQHARDRNRRRARPRRPASRPTRARSPPRSSSTRAACSRRRSARWRASPCRSCRWRTST